MELAARLGEFELAGQLKGDDLVAQLDADLAGPPQYLGEVEDEVLTVAQSVPQVRRAGGLVDDEEEAVDREALGIDGAGRLRL